MKMKSNHPMTRMADIKRQPKGDVLIKGILKYVLSQPPRDWRDKSVYDAIIDDPNESLVLNRLAWEFLRRNVYYVRIFYWIYVSEKRIKGICANEHGNSEEMAKYLKAYSSCLSKLVIFGVDCSKIPNPGKPDLPVFISDFKELSNFPRIDNNMMTIERPDIIHIAGRLNKIK
jgi:hypothetical protein